MMDHLHRTALHLSILQAFTQSEWKLGFLSEPMQRSCILLPSQIVNVLISASVAWIEVEFQSFEECYQVKPEADTRVIHLPNCSASVVLFVQMFQ